MENVKLGRILNDISTWGMIKDGIKIMILLAIVGAWLGAFVGGFVFIIMMIFGG